MNDFTVENHGSIFLVRPLTDEVKGWLNEHVAEDAQWFGGALAVEHRYVSDLVQGLLNEGFALDREVA